MIHALCLAKCFVAINTEENASETVAGGMAIFFVIVGLILSSTGIRITNKNSIHFCGRKKDFRISDLARDNLSTQGKTPRISLFIYLLSTTNIILCFMYNIGVKTDYREHSITC